MKDEGIGRSKLSDISYSTDDSSCGNRTYSRDTGKNPSGSKEKSILYFLGKEEDSILKVLKLIEEIPDALFQDRSYHLRAYG